MTKLLDAFVKSLEQAQGIYGARTAHFVFTDDGTRSAFLSEIGTEELVQLLEQWCRQQRTEMQVH